MKAFVIVAVAVVALLGLGWYFANTNLQTGTQHALQKAAPSSQPSAQAALKTSAPPAANSQAADVRPSDQLGAKENLKIDFVPSGPRKAVKASKSHGDADFEMPSDENEVVGKYVHRQMVYPKGRSKVRDVPMNDDLLVLEGRSEDRLSATR